MTAGMKNYISRFISDWIIKYKTRKFEKEFDMYYTGLLLGELYDAKIRLLTYMKNNKSLMLNKYLETRQSVNSQIMEKLDAASNRRSD